MLINPFKLKCSLLLLLPPDTLINVLCLLNQIGNTMGEESWWPTLLGERTAVIYQFIFGHVDLQHMDRQELSILYHLGNWGELC